MRIRYCVAMLALALTYPSLSVAGTISCVSTIPNKSGAEQSGMAAGTVVGIIVGAYASDADITITMLSADLGCNAGSAMGKVYMKADNSAMTFNGKIYALLHTTPEQGLIRYLGPAQGAPQQQPQQAEVISISPGYNLIVMPLADKAMQQMGVSEQDRKNIEILAAPPSPANIQRQVDTVKKILGF